MTHAKLMGPCYYLERFIIPNSCLPATRDCNPIRAHHGTEGVDKMLAAPFGSSLTFGVLTPRLEFAAEATCHWQASGKSAIQTFTNGFAAPRSHYSAVKDPTWFALNLQKVLPILSYDIFHHEALVGSNHISCWIGIDIWQLPNADLGQRPPSGWRFQHPVPLFAGHIAIKQIVKFQASALVPPPKTGANTVGLHWRPFSNLCNASQQPAVAITIGTLRLAATWTSHNAACLAKHFDVAHLSRSANESWNCCSKGQKNGRWPSAARSGHHKQRCVYVCVGRDVFCVKQLNIKCFLC